MASPVSPPHTTVICAVWHGDEERIDRLRGHAKNLDDQSVAVERIYVFDGNDTAPAWLPGKVAAVREALTIYQAWNVALSMVETPFVMNLNLDDRLAPDAVQTFQHALQTNNQLVRLPMIVGNYHSNPEKQAEFRYGTADEIERLKSIGVRIV